MHFAIEEQAEGHLGSNWDLGIREPREEGLVEALRKQKKDVVSVEGVLGEPSQSQVFEADTEFQNRQTLMNRFSFAACCLNLGEVRILQSRGAVMDCLGECIAAQVSRQPALHPQAC